MGTLAPSLHETQPGGGHAEEGSSRVCLITVGGELLAIDLRHVREVFEVESSTPVPGLPPSLTGVANLRGLVIPLIDLRSMLGLATTGSPPQFGVVVKHGTHQLAVLIESVPEIRTVQRSQLLPAVINAEGKSRPMVSAVLKLEDRLGAMLEVPLIFRQMEAREM